MIQFTNPEMQYTAHRLRDFANLLDRAEEVCGRRGLGIPWRAECADAAYFLLTVDRPAAVRGPKGGRRQVSFTVSYKWTVDDFEGQLRRVAEFVLGEREKL